jgi:hypothetical protein
MNVDIELLDYQIEFLQSDKPMTFFIGGRSTGKSYVLGMKIATTLLEGFNVLGISQTYKTAKLVLMKAVTDALDIIGAPYEVNIGDLTLKVNKSTLYLFSGESLESVRGLTNIKMLAVDEIALIPEEGFNIASACLRGQGAPRIYCCTTPRGRHWINKYIEDENNCIIRATTHANTYLDSGFIKLLESQYSYDFARQEILGEILNIDAPNQMIPSALLSKAQGYSTKFIQNEKIIIAVDPSRFGQDETVLYVRKGYNIVDRDSLDKSDTHDIVRLVEKYERKYGKDNIEAINFDGTGGYASGAIDILKLSRSNVHEYNFAANSPEDHCNNFRTYIYNLVIQYINAGGKIGNDEQLFTQLSAQEYIISKNGKKQLVPKNNIKQKLGKSPDDSDSFALTLVTNGDMFVSNKLTEQINNDAFSYRFKRIGSKSGFKNDA